MTIFMTEDDEEIHETFYLREKIDSLLQVAVSVTSSDEGMRILLEPSGPALDMNSSDQRLDLCGYNLRVKQTFPPEKIFWKTKQL